MIVWMLWRRSLGRGTVRLYRLATRARNKAFSLAAGGAFRAFGARSVLELPLRLAGGGGVGRALSGGSDSPPIGGAGAQRPARMVRHLPSLGWEPVVVTGP